MALVGLWVVHLHCRPWTTFLPLAIVLGVAMVKEAVEDYKRHKQDVEVNNRAVEVSTQELSAASQQQQAQDLTVGAHPCSSLTWSSSSSSSLNGFSWAYASWVTQQSADARVTCTGVSCGCNRWQWPCRIKQLRMITSAVVGAT